MIRIIALAVTCLLVTTGSAWAQGASGSVGPFSFTAEALLWWFKGNPTPPSVTTGTTGALGDPGTKVLIGGDDVDTNPNPGFRLTAGYAFSEQFGLETSVFYVPTRSTSREVSSSGQPGSKDLFVPVIDVTLPGEVGENISAAGFFSGHAREKVSNSLLGADFNGTMRVAAGAGWRLDVLGGFRYMRLRESYTLTTDSPNIPPFIQDIYSTTDQFDATNNFFGGQLGAKFRGDWGNWFANANVKVGLGAMVQTVEIAGILRTNDFNNFGAPISYVGGGYFATPTNIGQRTRSVFSVIPEAGLTVGYRINSWLSVVAGYTFLYASDVVRAPGQVVRTVNYSSFNAAPGVPIGPQEPSFKFKSSDFWAQGINLGVSLRF